MDFSSSMTLAVARSNTATQLNNTLQLANFSDGEISATVGNIVRSVKVY